MMVSPAIRGLARGMGMSQQRNAIGEEMVAAGLISRDQLKTALDYQASLGGTLTQIVVKLNYVHDNKMTNWLSKKFKVPIADLMSVFLPVDLVKRIPWELIQKHQVVPLHVEGKTLTIATADPLDYDAVEELQFATSLQIDFHLSPRSHIVKAIKELATTLGRGTPSQPQLVPPPKTRPASAGALASFGGGGEDELLDGLKERVSTSAGQSVSKGELREALIPALLKKGVITKSELYDCVIDLLVQKGVVEPKDLRPQQK